MPFLAFSDVLVLCRHLVVVKHVLKERLVAMGVLKKVKNAISLKAVPATVKLNKTFFRNGGEYAFGSFVRIITEFNFFCFC